MATSLHKRMSYEDEYEVARLCTDGEFERALAEQFEGKLELARRIAQVPMGIRGFGHVRLGNLVLARTREAELLHRFDPARHAAPPAPPGAGSLRGIPVVTR